MTSLSRIYDFLLWKYSSEACLYGSIHPSLFPLVQWHTDPPPSVHAHTHTNMSRPWYARHARTTRRMISIHSVGRASHSGVHPQGARNVQPQPLPANHRCIPPNWVKKENSIFERCLSPPASASQCMHSSVTALEFLVALWCGTSEWGCSSDEVFTLKLSHFKGTSRQVNHRFVTRLPRGEGDTLSSTALYLKRLRVTICSNWRINHLLVAMCHNSRKRLLRGLTFMLS